MTTKTLAFAALLCCFHPIFLTAQNFDVYVSDAGNFENPPWKILKFDHNGENGSVFISEHLAWPQDILFLEEFGTMLVSNFNTDRISKFNAETGAFLGEFATGIDAPTRMKFGKDSLIYVLQWFGNGRVHRYKTDGTFVDEFTSTGVATSIGMDWDSEGNFYVSSYNGKYVRKFSPTGADLGNFINSNLAGPTNIWFAANGDMLVNDYNSNNVKRFSSTGQYLGIFATPVGQCEGVAFPDPAHILIGVGGASSVRLFDTTGTKIKEFIPSGTLGLMTPNAVVLRPTSTSGTHELFREVNFVQPSVGSVFQLVFPEGMEPASQVEIHNAAGVLIKTMDISQGTIWNAAGLPNGMYCFTAKLKNGPVVRQKVMISQ